MADEEVRTESNEASTIAERWLAEQQAWQKTVTTYLDSMVNNDDFLVHLGNAMRGSLLAGKPYPTAPAPGAAEPLNETDDRIDEILHAIHQIQGELRDLRTAVESLESRVAAERAPQGARPVTAADVATAAPGGRKVPGPTSTSDEPADSQATRGAATGTPTAMTQQPATDAEGGDTV